MMFRKDIFSATLCLGYSRACSSISGDMTAEATVNDPWAFINPSSTRFRTARFSRTTSRNCFISSSRLSFSSLCPRLAVLSRFFSRVSSIRVGFTFMAGILSPPSSMEGAGRYSCPSSAFLGRYFSMNSGLMRFSSLLGRMLRSSQPRSSVSSMLRFSSLPWFT